MNTKGFVFSVFQMYFHVFRCISVCISVTMLSKRGQLAQSAGFVVII
jgi:hypothetical protein